MTTREHIYLDTAKLFGSLSTCTRGKVGCVIVQDKRIISTGYNGAPSGQPHCSQKGCDMSRGKNAGCQRAIHAEANAIAYAARAGVSVEKATIFCTHGPCLKCAQLMVASGITQVVYDIPYRLDDGLILLDNCDVRVVHL